MSRFWNYCLSEWDDLIVTSSLIVIGVVMLAIIAASVFGICQILFS